MLLRRSYLEYFGGMIGARQRRLVHQLLDTRSGSVTLTSARSDVVQSHDGVILKAAHEAMSRHALAAQETGAILARGFRFALILAGSANGLLVPLGGVDAHHGRHYVIERERFHRLSRF